MDKLEPNTRISVGTIGTSREFPYVAMSASVESLPLYLPKKHFQDRYLRVSFYSHTQQTTIFSMEVSRDSMDKVRPIKLKLDKPNPNLRIIAWWKRVRYKPAVSKRMSYVELPYWNKEIGKLTSAPQKPMLHVDNGEGKTATIEMGDFCMGDRWHATLPDDFAPTSASTITYTVEYDSGGLFDSVATKFEYDYRVGVDTD
ncbi:hypothetical protein [Mariniblastus fucicola]|uniref:hypothetical protein n=1 Tax=Mariniblastus fucicola TaxID=980251 RepID=UPI0011DF4D25|nr:hypothetical protein [Mariniblastus fucicola]